VGFDTGLDEVAVIATTSVFKTLEKVLDPAD
jgi:hypothetical protein